MNAIVATPSVTDENISFSSEEFVWSSAECTPAHELLRAPVLRMLRDSGARKVLDLGCGNGAFTNELRAAGLAVTGCDMSSSGIDWAQRQFPHIPFFAQDLAQPVPPDHDGRYDAVVSTEVIEHLLLPRLLLRNAFAALRPGGVLILSTPFHGYWKNLALALTNKFDDHWHPLRDFGHVKFFSRRTLSGLLQEQGFTIQEFARVGRVPVFACHMIVAARKPE